MMRKGASISNNWTIGNVTDWRDSNLVTNKMAAAVGADGQKSVR